MTLKGIYPMTAYNFTEAVGNIADGIGTAQAGRDSVEKGWGLLLTGIASDRAQKVTVASIASKIKKANVTNVTELPVSGSSVSNYEAAAVIWALPGEATIDGKKVVARLDAPGKAHGTDSATEVSLPSFIRAILRRDDCDKDTIMSTIAKATTRKGAVAALIVKVTSLDEKAELAAAAAAAAAEEAAAAETPEEQAEEKAKKVQTIASLVKASQGSLSRADKGEDKEGVKLEIGDDLAGEIKKVRDFLDSIESKFVKAA